MAHALARYLDIENEDDLTRIVFGLLELTGPPVLTDILEVAGGSISDDATVDFHTPLDPRAERVPDVLIEDSDTTVLIEAKRGADFDLEQLRDEHEELQQFGNRQKRLLLVSSYRSKPPAIDELALEHTQWLSWRDISIQISNYDRADLSEAQTRLLDLLQTKLEEEGYDPFTGFSEPVLDDLSRLSSTLTAYRSEIATFHRDVEGRLRESGLQAKNMWRNGVSQDYSRFPADLQFVPSYLWIAYGEPEFTIDTKDQHYLFVAFCLDARTPLRVRVGYSISPTYSSTNHDLVTVHEFTYPRLYPAP